MTANTMKLTDLRRWNLVQVVMMRRLGIGSDIDEVASFSYWFAQIVDQLQRLPRFSEVQRAFKMTRTFQSVTKVSINK